MNSTMVTTEPQIFSQLQARVEAHDEKLESLSSQVRDLTTSVNSMKEVLTNIPKSLGKLMLTFQKSGGIQPDKPTIPSITQNRPSFHSGQTLIKTNDMNISNLSLNQSTRSHDQFMGMLLQGLKEEIIKLVQPLNPKTASIEFLPSVDENQDSSSKSRSSHLVKTLTPTSESILKKYRHFAIKKGSSLTENSNEGLLVPSISLRSISSLIHFDKPRCKMKVAKLDGFESGKAQLQLIMKALKDYKVNIIVEEVGRQADALQLFDEMAVVVSHKPYLRKLRGDLAEMLELNLKDEGELLSTECLHGRLNQVKRIHVERDDVWTPLDLRTICIPQVVRDLRHKINHVWRDAASYLTSSSTTNHVKGMYANIFALLELNFYFLKDEEPKSSVLLYNLFQEDIDNPMDYLVRYGTGLRALQDVHTLEEARDRVHAIIENLKAWCLLVDSDVEDCFLTYDVTCYFLLSVASGVFTYVWRMMRGYLDSPNENKFSNSRDTSMILKNLEEFPIGINCQKFQLWQVKCSLGLREFLGNFLDGRKVLIVLMQHVLLKVVGNTVNPSHTCSLWLQREKRENYLALHCVLYYLSKGNKVEMKNPILIDWYRGMSSVTLRIKTKETRSAKRLYKVDKHVIASLDVRANKNGDLVVTKGGQYDVREEKYDNKMRYLGKPVEIAEKYFFNGADEVNFLIITGLSAFPLDDLPLVQILRYYSSLEVTLEYFRSGVDKISIGSDVYAAEQYLKSRVNTEMSGLKQIFGVYESWVVVVNIDPRSQYLKSPYEVRFKSIKVQKLGPISEEDVWYHSTVNSGGEGPPIGTSELAKAVEELEAGQILLNCDDQEKGFDIDLIMLIPNVVSILVIAALTSWTVFQTLGLRTSLIFKRVALIEKMLRSDLEPNLTEKRSKCMERSPKSPIGLLQEEAQGVTILHGAPTTFLDQ